MTINDVGKPEVGAVRLAAVGDIMLGDSAICTGYGFASRYSGTQFTESMSALAESLKPADILFGNLECSLSRHGHDPYNWASTQLRGRPDFVAGLSAVGFNIMNVANNHAFQHGSQAFEDTVALLHDAGIATCGVRGSGPWCSEPTIMTARGRRIGFLGYCLRPRQYSVATPPYAEGSDQEIAADIGRLRSSVDHLVVSLHWGEEYVPLPSKREVRLAHDIVDAGADVILGHHPHVPRPVERYGDGIIAYSLGNFIADMIWYEPLREPLLVKLDLALRPENISVSRLWIEDSYLPVRDDSKTQASATSSVPSLDQAAYERETARTVRRGQVGSYVHAVRNARRFRSPTLRQLLRVTARNKMAALGRMIRTRVGAA